MRAHRGRALLVTIPVVLLIAGASRADAQPAAADDDDAPPFTAPAPEASPLEPPARVWAAAVFVGYSPAGLLGLEVERAISGPFAAALAVGLYPRAELETWTAHGGAALRARFLRDSPFHLALEANVAYGDEGRGTDEDPKFTGVVYVGGALHLEIENQRGWFVRLVLGGARPVTFRDCSADACRSNPNDPTDRGLPTVLVSGGNRF